jgi:23S rRNA pseudouridine1911/1915/1917 synthase
MNCMKCPLFEIIHEDEQLLVINKPAGLVCHPTKTDEYSSLISRVRLHLGNNSRPQLINRLDRETSGITVVAKDERTARQLRKLWESRQVRKGYRAIVHRTVSQLHGRIDAPLGKDERSRVAIKDCVRPDGVAASTEYRVEKHFTRSTSSALTSECSKLSPQEFTLLRITPHTGRKHQIRIHLAHIGHPIVGDKLYGEDEELYLALVEDRLTSTQWEQLILPHQALHAGELRFAWRDRELEYRAQPERWFREFVENIIAPA